MERLTCLNESNECQGPVDYWSSGSSMKSWPRCDYHGMKRQEQASDPNSMEMYANSDVPPCLPCRRRRDMVNTS